MRKFINYLGSIGADKYLHLLVSLLLTFIIGQGVHIFTGDNLALCGAVGATAALCIGIAKEAYDEFTGGDFGYKDIFFDIIGCLLGIIITAF